MVIIFKKSRNDNEDDKDNDPLTSDDEDDEDDDDSDWSVEDDSPLTDDELELVEKLKKSINK